jgi:hypothetical protein
MGRKPGVRLKGDESEIARTKPLSSSGRFILRTLRPRTPSCLASGSPRWLDSPEDVLSEIRRIFEGVPKEALTAVYKTWISMVEWTTELKGEIIALIKRNPCSLQMSEKTGSHRFCPSR